MVVIRDSVRHKPSHELTNDHEGDCHEKADTPHRGLLVDIYDTL